MIETKFAVGDLVRYGGGCTAMMRVTSHSNGRYYGKAFHSSDTCMGRYWNELAAPSPRDHVVWACHHDESDNYVFTPRLRLWLDTSHERGIS